jgi:hypothetical protein
MGPPQDFLLPNTAERMRRRLREEQNILERKVFSILALLRQHHGPEAFQRRQLPIDVVHLGLRKVAM